MSETVIDTVEDDTADTADAEARILLDAIDTVHTTSNAAFALGIRCAVEFVERAEIRPDVLAPGAVFDVEAAEISAIAEVAARRAVSGATVKEWLQVYRTARPLIRDAFDAGTLPYSKFRTICRTLDTVPNVTDELIEKVLAAAGRCSPSALTPAIDRIIAEYDADWHRKAREKADAERTMKVRKLRHGQAELTLTGPQTMIAAMAQSIGSVAKKLCFSDPRLPGTRMFDAAASILTGSFFGCGCSNEECPHRCTITSDAPKARAYIVIDALTAAGLSDESGYIEGWGNVPADVARRLAEDATWQAIITDAQNARHTCDPCPNCDGDDDDPPDDDGDGGPPGGGGPPDTGPPDTDPDADAPDSDTEPADADVLTNTDSDPAPVPTPSPEVRRSRRVPAGWTAATGPATPSPSRDRLEQTMAFLRLVAQWPRALDPWWNRTGHGGHRTPPPGALAYAPSEALRLMVQSTYETCVHPGCTVPSTDCDLDHAVPFDHQDPQRGGWTVFGNLEPLCRGHHGLKTRKQWTYRILTHGIVHIRDPHGRNYFTPPTRPV